MKITAIETFTTEFVDLSGIDGNVFFSMNLQAMETSTNSNFESISKDLISKLQFF